MEGIRLSRQLPRALLLVALLLALIALAPSKAFAAQVHCGDVITQDTRVDNDLIDCPGDGLVIGADDVTLDLNGHTIDGVGKGSGIAVGVVAGDTFGFDRVTIRNGTIRAFAFGVRLDESPESHLQQLSVLGTGRAIEGTHSSDAWIEQNDIYGNGQGIFFESRARIENNRVSNNGFGIQVSYSSTQIRDNYVFGNQGSGIGAGPCGPCLIERNVVVENGGSGITLSGGSGNRIARNKVFRNRRDGIAIYAYAFDTGPSEIVDNTSSSNGQEGVFLAWQVTDTLVARNTTNRNAHDGIELQWLGEDHAYPGGNTLTSNKARRNGNLGIESAPGNFDGGGNKAFGNGNPLQCLNVVCK